MHILGRTIPIPPTVLFYQPGNRTNVYGREDKMRRDPLPLARKTTPVSGSCEVT